MRNALLKAGLTSNEAEVYLSLLKLGRTSATALARQAGMHRTSVYGALARLERKGLATAAAVDGMRRFSAVHPRKLRQLVHEQVSTVEQSIPLLEQLHASARYADRLQHFHGESGVATIHEEILHHCGREGRNQGLSYCGYGPALASELKQAQALFGQRAAEERIAGRVVYDERSAHLAPNPLEDRRFLAGQRAPLSPEIVRVFGERVAVIFPSLPEPFCVLIRDAEIAAKFEARFRELWKAGEE